MGRLAFISFVMALGLMSFTAASGCADDGTADQDTAPLSDVGGADAAKRQDTAAEAGILCCPLGNCPTGDLCLQGACLPETGEGTCYFDGQCADGQDCVGATACGCGETDCEPVKGSCSYPEGCCNGDDDCGDTEICNAGVCRDAAPSAGCWRDDQCSGDLSCLDVQDCACGDDGCTATAGFCGAAGICCDNDEECGSDVCRGGRCVERPVGGVCYGDGDCSGGDICRGEDLCECGLEASCAMPTTAGRCGPEVGPQTCCVDSGDCTDGEICVEGQGCLAAPTGNECWVDDHCGIGRVCDGATVCACSDSGCTDTAGQCVTTARSCTGDVECGTGMRCIIPDSLNCEGLPRGAGVSGVGGLAPAPEGVCVEAVDGGCWQASDCPRVDERCGGEVICTDPSGCDAPNDAGLCRDTVLIRDCCDSQQDCGPGLQCRNGNTTLTCPPSDSAICVPEPVFGEDCWNFLDCPTGDVCNRSWMCGCNGKCYFNRMGVCEKPLFCDSNVECGPEEICARDPECIASPCTTTSTCLGGGVCQPKEAGRCWSHEECGEDGYCDGLRVCPLNSTCIAPDNSGQCAPRGLLGECCTSFYGCDGGLRCVSVAQKSACTTDISAICVPAITQGTDCYTNDDCGEDQLCQGATTCACGVASCTSPPAPGTCVAD